MNQTPADITALFAGHRFQVRVDAALHTVQRRYLDGFRPETDLVASCGHTTRIRVRADTGVLRDRVRHLAARPEQRVTPFRGEPYLYSRSAPYEWWRPAPDAPLHDDHLYGREMTGRVQILVRPDTERPERYAARVVRDVVMRCAEHRGWSVFHAAAVAVGGRGVLIAGPSGSGKTSVLAALSAHLSADVVACDRALLTDGAGRVVGVPLSVRVAGGTLQALGHPGLPVPEGLPREFGAGRKVAPLPRDFTRALGVRLPESAPLGLIVLPQLHDGEGEVRVERVSPDAARAALTAACCTPYDEDWLLPWFADRTRSVEELARQSDAIVTAALDRAEVVRVSAGVRGRHLLKGIAEAVAGGLG